jgi:hypothetical protein
MAERLKANSQGNKIEVSLYHSAKFFSQFNHSLTRMRFYRSKDRYKPEGGVMMTRQIILPLKPATLTEILSALPDFGETGRLLVRLVKSGHVQLVPAGDAASATSGVMTVVYRAEDGVFAVTKRIVDEMRGLRPARNMAADMAEDCGDASVPFAVEVHRGLTRVSAQLLS